MFGFLKKRQGPAICRSNPGKAIEGVVSIRGPEGERQEAINLMAIGTTVLQNQGYTVENKSRWLSHPESGLIFVPQFVEMDVSERHVRTTTTIQINHPRLAPDGVFEFQHSTGQTVTESISKGIESWSQTDLVPLLDALRPKPETCAVLELKMPATDSRPERVRRAVLGPVAHFMSKPPPSGGADEEHPFCPCCLLTQSIEAFQDYLRGDTTCCLRLFAARDEHGKPQADCRVNGAPYDAGVDALSNYASTWPSAGFEFRKQYVVIHNLL
jgi:hypothetical protein